MLYHLYCGFKELGLSFLSLKYYWLLGTLFNCMKGKENCTMQYLEFPQLFRGLHNEGSKMSYYNTAYMRTGLYYG